MKAARKLQRLQQPASLIDFVRQFLTPRVWKQARQCVADRRSKPRWDLQPLVLVLVAMTWAVGDGRASLRYLAPYVFRVAIGNGRIVSCEDGNVTFTYRRVGSKRLRKMSLDAMEFLRRFLQHVLPAGFQKVRHYGFLSPNCATSIEAVRWMVTVHNQAKFVLLAKRTAEPAAQPVPRCPSCGGPMVLLEFVPALAPFDTS